MRPSIIAQLALGSVVVATPLPQEPKATAGTTPAKPANPLGGLDLGALLGGLGGSDGASLDLGALLGGLDLGALTGGAGGTGGAPLDLGALLGSIGSPTPSTDVIIAGYTAVNEKVVAYDTAINALPATGDASAAIKDVLEKSKAVETALMESSVKIAAISTVELLASINLSSPGNDVTVLIEKATDDLISKKDIIIKANQKAAMLQQAKNLRAAIGIFTKGINAKLPSISSSEAEVVSQRSLDALDKAVAAFSS
jgi:hypothetical protein